MFIIKVFLTFLIMTPSYADRIGHSQYMDAKVIEIGKCNYKNKVLAYTDFKFRSGLKTYEVKFNSNTKIFRQKKKLKCEDISPHQSIQLGYANGNDNFQVKSNYLIIDSIELK